MELYLHFGLYKTGSSYLQTICANNRDFLKAHDVCFPKGELDDDMMKGVISPGNGWNLTELLQKGDVQKISGLMKRWKDEAVSQGCNKVLISTESLIHGMTNDRQLHGLWKAAQDNGFGISAFCFVREPADHCLSTFKHRAKKGKINDFAEWVEKTYETMDVLRDFLAIYKSVPIRWKFSKYEFGEYMLISFFNDWLGVPVPEESADKSVNPSLTLSELLIIKILRKKQPHSILHVYRSFLKLKPQEKANDKELEQQYKSVVQNKLRSRQLLIDQINELLGDNKKLVGFNAPAGDVSAGNFEIRLSERQAGALISGLKVSDKLSNRLRFIIRRNYKKMKSLF